MSAATLLSSNLVNPCKPFQALALVEEETRRYRPTKNYLEHLPPLNLAAFETPMLRTELDRVSSRQPMETLSMKRYGQDEFD